MKNPATHKQPNLSGDSAKLRQRAELRLRGHPTKVIPNQTDADNQRRFHELEVHQIELEMQNTELRKVRDELEVMLEKYTDLYDFAPVGYFSIDESGVILEANLTSAALLGVERSRLINRRLLLFISPASRSILLNYLKEVFAAPKNQVCEALLLKEGVGTFWAGFQATSAVSLQGTRKSCRVAFGDITDRKQAEEAQSRIETLAVANRELEQEIVLRQAVEEDLRKSEQHYAQLLEQSRQMQEQLRLLSRKSLSAQEEERKKISRELHDVIAQTLTGINVRLSALQKEAGLNTTKGVERSILRTQQLVEHSVNIVHRFARELRPTVLDDVGLIPALHSFMKEFTERTGIRMHLTTFGSAIIKQLDSNKRTVLYRVAQEALNNVARHAQASRAEVTIQKLDGQVCMKIKDNGKGFPAGRALHAKRSKRLGLLGMKERLEMVNGNFTIESAPGKGTTIQAQVPLVEVRARGKAENSLKGTRRSRTT
jgi:PAS domain S-box-containing protein